MDQEGMMFSVPCKSCKKPIVFLKTDTGKIIPVDAETVDAADEHFDFERHKSHFATCPEAAKFRKPKQTTIKWR
jgi:hypothetical protein